MATLERMASGKPRVRAILDGPAYRIARRRKRGCLPRAFRAESRAASRYVRTGCKRAVRSERTALFPESDRDFFAKTADLQIAFERIARVSLSAPDRSILSSVEA